MEQYINEIIRPKIQGDGGQITFLSKNDNEITVIMEGECSKCMILHRCIAWIENCIEDEFGEKITIKPVRKKPFFWDK